LCPDCSEWLDQAWWGERMDAAWSDDQSRFGDLDVVTPCCAANSSLNDLPSASAGCCRIGASLVLLRPGKLRHRSLPGVALAASVPTWCRSVPGRYSIRGAPMRLTGPARLTLRAVPVMLAR
jgi:hypothetical protein